MNFLLVAAAAGAGAILLSLLTFASANTDLFAHQYPLLLGANIAVAITLLALIGIQLRKLYRDHRRGVFGTRLKTRLERARLAACGTFGQGTEYGAGYGRHCCGQSGTS